jgi:hypothetical protein
VLATQPFNTQTMKPHFEKFFINPNAEDKAYTYGTIPMRLKNIKAIWNNDFDDDNGLEKMFRLFLAFSQFLFPGLYIKHFFSKRFVMYQDFAVDLYVMLKLIYPFVLITSGMAENKFCIYILVWLMLETMLYVPRLIFASDIIEKPRSYRRSMLLLFINYIEIILDFAVLYAHGEYLNKAFVHWFDPIYFSFITAATIGFGDFHPITPLGKFLVSFQSTLIIVFIAIFLNFFTGKVESKGYFGESKKP